MPPSRQTRGGSPWSIDEYVVVADLYLRRARSSGVRDPEVLDLSRLTGRTPASISRRLGNFDGTERAGMGLKPVTGDALVTFRRMQRDDRFRNRIVQEARSHLMSSSYSTDADAVIVAPLFVDPEDFQADRFTVETEAVVREALRLEAKLVRQYQRWRDPDGTRLRGLVIPVSGQLLRADLYDSELDLLIEAKGLTTRDGLRQAVGQLIDYGRYLSPRPRMAILLPAEPDRDLAALPREVGIETIWRTAGGFADSVQGSLSTPDQSRPPRE